MKCGSLVRILAGRYIGAVLEIEAVSITKKGTQYIVSGVEYWPNELELVSPPVESTEARLDRLEEAVGEIQQRLGLGDYYPQSG